VNQLVFTQILSETGLTFVLVRNGALAVEAWREMKPRMILMDVSMPEMNGLEATGRIREEEEAAGRRTPIIGVTAHAFKGDRERCLEAGMDDYLSKPISPKALLEKISKLDRIAVGEADGSKPDPETVRRRRFPRRSRRLRGEDVLVDIGQGAVGASGADQRPFVEFQFEAQRAGVLSSGRAGQGLPQGRLNDVEGRGSRPHHGNRGRDQ
jgi:CheY-like chemotaxis protein